MDLPEEAYQIFVIVIVISIAMVFVSYFTKNGRNFRSSRNKKARKQF